MSHFAKATRDNKKYNLGSFAAPLFLFSGKKCARMGEVGQAHTE